MIIIYIIIIMYDYLIRNSKEILFGVDLNS